ncbi:type IV pilus biogenesis protein PilM [Chungangia koreensis]|uniref:Type IV pilus biogenesis protein PilM n=1 Tax=Chungangia koreensis TaxID=752657 RepID=A0ABV8X293_9LACT
MYTYWKNHPAVFVTFTEKYIRVLVGGRKNRYTKIIQEFIEDETDDLLLIEQLRDIVKKYKLKGLPAFFSYSNQDLLLRSTTIPIQIPREEWKGHLYMELGESFQLPFENPIIEVVGDRLLEGRQEVTALAVPESDVQRLESILKESKLHPVVIDLPFLSLYRFFGEHFSISESSHVLLLQLELDHIQISMFHDHQPLYVRSLTLPQIPNLSSYETRSGFQYWTAPDESLEMDEHFSVIQNEIDRLRTFYQYNLQGGSKEIDTFCISGDHPLIEKLTETYNSEQLQVFHSNEEILLTKDGLEIPPSFTELIGLSWK